MNDQASAADSSSFADNQFKFTSIFSLESHSLPLERIGTGKCRAVNEFRKIGKLGEGTYGVVYKGTDCKAPPHLSTVALKQVRLRLDKSQRNSEGLSISVIREIYALVAVPQHPNIVRLFDVAVGRRLEKIFLVMEYCDQDLATLLDNMSSPFTEAQVKCLLQQLFRGLAHLHDYFIIHRDVKVSNLLITSRGILKIADFGLARTFGDPPAKMTAHVVTLWYRSPELLLDSKFQSTAIDMWAGGCIMGELLLHRPLLPGTSELDQMRRIINLLGTPTERIWPGLNDLKPLANIQLFQQPFNNLKTLFPDASTECLALMNRLFVYDPRRRISARECLECEYFTVSPLPCDPYLMPSLGGLTKRRKRPQNGNEEPQSRI